MPAKTTARLRFVSIPPRKLRLVANLVKGMPIQKALDTLNFTPRIAAYHIAKTLKSAAANALSTEGTAHLKPEDLFVKNIYVDMAPTAKRIRFQSMGRVFRYRKRFSHLTVHLEEIPQAKAVRAAAVKGKASKTAIDAPATKAKKTVAAKPIKAATTRKTKTKAEPKETPAAE